ncbi:unnamed protein product [Sphagnum troendelagicum]|uniref:Uncharacterized protein n=1 Tax=Sphagnum troendelagicum TaxID=128251 RepID=A0ABP0U5H7_9BRYO
MYANFSSLDYVHGGVGSVTFQLVKQCQDFSFGLFSGDILNYLIRGFQYCHFLQLESSCISPVGYWIYMG